MASKNGVKGNPWDVNEESGAWGLCFSISIIRGQATFILTEAYVLRRAPGLDRVPVGRSLGESGLSTPDWSTNQSSSAGFGDVLWLYM